MSAPAPKLPSPLAQVMLVFRKDMLIEWRGRSRLFAMAAYAVTMLLLFSFGVGDNSKILQMHAGGYLWLSVLTASTMLLAQSFQTETESGALEGLILMPVSPVALYYGKALANTVVLLALALVATPVTLFLFDFGVPDRIPALLGLLVLGVSGVAAPGTLYAGLTARLSAQQLMLPLLLFPLVVPALVSASKATGLLLAGDPMNQVGSWMALLLCFNLIYWSLAGLLFTKVVEQ